MNVASLCLFGSKLWKLQIQPDDASGSLKDEPVCVGRTSVLLIGRWCWPTSTSAPSKHFRTFLFHFFCCDGLKSLDCNIAPRSPIISVRAPSNSPIQAGNGGQRSNIHLHFLHAHAHTQKHTRVSAPPPLASSCRTKRPRCCRRAPANLTKTRKNTHKSHRTRLGITRHTPSRTLVVWVYVLNRKKCPFQGSKNHQLHEPPSS